MLMSVQLRRPTGATTVYQMLQVSLKLTSVFGEESDCTGADTADSNSELQCYTPELQDIAPLQAQSAIQYWLDRRWHWILWCLLFLKHMLIDYFTVWWSDNKKMEQY